LTNGLANHTARAALKLNNTLYLAIPAESPMVFFRLKSRNDVFD
jgi:hypothetical protein